MDAPAFRHLYDYHFAANRAVWDRCVVPLTDEQFTRNLDYSVGSVRNQVVHLFNMDERWFSGLRGVPIPGFRNPAHFATRPVIRQHWDAVEADMRGYLAVLRDAMLDDQPFLAIDGDPIRLWQALLHVVNHGTDHRAQLLVVLRQLGVPTFPQDYADYIEGRL
jgi:uncharacterized damage-inducible protein DinB